MQSLQFRNRLDRRIFNDPERNGAIPVSWIFSKALIQAYENSLCLPGRVAEYLAGNCSDGNASALICACNL